MRDDLSTRAILFPAERQGLRKRCAFNRLDELPRGNANAGRSICGLSRTSLFRWCPRSGGPDANAHGPALRLIDFEGIGLAHKVAQLAEAVGPWIEIRCKVGKLSSDFPKRHPAIFAFHLRDDFLMIGVAASGA